MPHFISFFIWTRADIREIRVCGWCKRNNAYVSAYSAYAAGDVSIDDSKRTVVLSQ